ncbi:hypothetical protein J6590_060825 [Homalodisca vitripennis]|nr:hypothetical protein J6590_060825 [Homalodisca vitripennis]
MPTTYKRKSNRQSWSQGSMEAVINEVLLGNMGYFNATKSHNLPERTLEDRVKYARRIQLNPASADHEQHLTTKGITPPQSEVIERDILPMLIAASRDGLMFVNGNQQLIVEDPPCNHQENCFTDEGHVDLTQHICRQQRQGIEGALKLVIACFKFMIGDNAGLRRRLNLDADLRAKNFF